MRKTPTSTMLRQVPEVFKDKRDKKTWLFLVRALEGYKAHCALPNNFDEHYARTTVFPILLNRSHPEFGSDNVHQYLVGKLAEVIEKTRGTHRSNIAGQEVWLDEQVTAVKDYMAAAFPGLVPTKMSGHLLMTEIQSQAIGIDNASWKVTIVP